MSNIRLNLENSSISEKEMMEYKNQVAQIHQSMNERADKEGEFLGWLNLPSNYDKEEVARIKKAAEKIRKDSDILVVIGIGGSYLGSRAVIESLSHTFVNMVSVQKRRAPMVLYAGNNLSPNYVND